MSLNELIKRFLLVSGLQKKDVSLYLPVLIDAKTLFEEKTQDRSLTDAERRRLTHACAVYAFYKVSLYNNADALTSFKAGDVSFSVESLRERASLLWEKERASIGDLIRFSDDSFSFMGVRV
ncbi:MAG: hypothetical protein IJJ15_04450 [Ruminococcus sp.]|nr:hypothetical protein [Ruminococcus sp.]